MSNIINYVRPVQGQNRKDINRLLELLSDYAAPSVEEAGFQERITVTPHVKVRDTDVIFSGVDWGESEVRDKATRLMQKKVPNQPDTTPFDETWDVWGRRTIEYISSTHNTGSNNYRYYDLSNVTDYVVQAGDYLEYDIYIHPNATLNKLCAFDFETDTPSSVSLRGSGINDQNGINTFNVILATASYALGRWYHRKMDLTGGAFDFTGYNIYRFLIGNETDNGLAGIWFRNINITDGSTTVRKVIYQDAENTFSKLHDASTLNVTHKISDAIGIDSLRPYIFPTNDTKYGARCVMPNYLWIPHHTVMDSNDMTLAMFLKLPATSTGSNSFNILNKSNTFLLRIDPHSDASNRIAFFPYNPSAEPRVTYTYTPDTWFTLVISYDSASGTKIYVNGNSTPVDSDADSGNLATNTNGIAFGSGISIGAGLAFDGPNIEIAHLFLGSEPCTTNFQSNFHNGLLNTDDTDTDGVKEVFYKPLMGDFSYFNDASLGLMST